MPSYQLFVEKASHISVEIDEMLYDVVHKNYFQKWYAGDPYTKRKDISNVQHRIRNAISPPKKNAEPKLRDNGESGINNISYFSPLGTQRA